MKTIGLIGGMSWESTVSYYQIINNVVKEQLSGFHSAKCVLCSVDFYEIEALQTQGDWAEIGRIMAKEAMRLEQTGADFIVLCTNTIHKVADAIEQAVSIPLLHIADVTADALLKQEIHRVALLGTRYTMEQAFYKERLAQRGVEVLIPNEQQRERINRIIFEELCLGEIHPGSKAFYVEVMNDMVQKGAQGVVLGCTEIGLLVSQQDTQVPLFDTTQIHARQAALRALV